MSQKQIDGSGDRKIVSTSPPSDEESIEKQYYQGEGEEYGESYYIGIGSWSPSASRESDEDVYNKRLSHLESALMSSLLEDAIDELEILKYVIGEPMVLSWDFRYEAPEERLRRRLTPERIFPEVDSKPVLTSSLKLQRDREKIQLVFRKLLNSLLGDGSFTPLSYAVDDLKKEKSDDEHLIQDLRKNLKYLKELDAAVKEKRRLDDLEEKGRDELMYLLQDELDDVILKCNVEERFVTKWERVRQEQNIWRLKQTENFYKEGLAKYTAQSKIEKRVTHEFQLYLKMDQSELEDELEDWMTQYDKEMERRENKILYLKYTRDQAEENKIRLQELYETRVKEMEEWVAFRELRKRRTKASLQIQSWWRGIMVRKMLGPYKPKKQKAEKGADKKKK